MSELRIKELETQLLAANELVACLTKSNAELTVGLASAEMQLKRSRRNSKRDEGTLRDQITTLQSRRG